MKFLTFVDIHQDKDTLKELLKRASKEDIDFVLCAGDFSTFGNGVRHVLTEINKLGKKAYFIPGNHEENISEWKVLLAEYKNCHDLHQQAVRIGNYLFLGYGGNGFSMQDEQFRKQARHWYSEYQDHKVVLVTHGPPFGTTLDKLEQGHVGNKDYRKFIERIKPKLVICGHLHETAGLTDAIGTTKLINPGWEGMVVELP